VILRERQFLLFGISPDRYSARGLWLFVMFFVATFLFAGLLGPLAYAAVQRVAEGDPGGWAAALLERPFDKFVDRCRYLALLLLLPLLMSQSGLAGKGFLRANDLAPRAGAGTWFGYALLLGCLLALLVATLQLVFTWYWPIEADFLSLALLSGVSALAIALVEEIIFRSLIFRLFYTALRPVAAIAAASILYAYLHFSAPPVALAAANESPGFLAGLQVALLNALGGVMNFRPLEFANYASLGALLCVLYLRAKTLWAPVGLHAGVVWVMLIYQESFAIFPDRLRWVFAGGGLTDGVVPLILTLALTVLLGLRLPVSRS